MLVPHGAVGTNYIDAEITARPKDSCARPEERTETGQSASKPEMDGDTGSSS
jgi:hypothetical protein